MKITGLAALGVASAAMTAWHAPALADDMVEDKLATMEQRIKYLEERVASQDQMIVDKESEIAGLSDGWFNSVSVGGVIELELASESPAGEDSTVSAGVGTAELGIAAALNDEWSGEILVENDDGTIALADAFLIFEPAGTGLSASMGQQGVPFGVYDTNMITDPATEVLGDTSGVSLALGGEAGQLNWNLFALQPEEDGQFADNYGVAVGFAAEGEGAEFGLNVSWINGVANAVDIQGMAVSARGSLGPASALVEYVTTLEAPEDGATPTAWSAEIAYGFDLMGREATLAAGAGGSDEGEDVEDLAETLMLLGISVGVWENVGIGIEWKQTERYGADDADDAVTALLAAEF